MNKLIIQYDDVVKLKNTSETWSFVSVYYFSFFATHVLLRFLNNSMIRLSKETTSFLETISNAKNSEVLKIAPDYYEYCLDSSTTDIYDNLIVTLYKPDLKVHEFVWNTLCKQLRKMQDELKIRDVIIDKILAIFEAFGNTFPSVIRNDINYKGEYSLQEFNKQLTFSRDLPLSSANLSSKILNIKINDTSEKNKMHAVLLIGMVILEIVLELYKDLHTRSSSHSNHTAEMNNKRLNYLQSKLSSPKTKKIFKI